MTVYAAQSGTFAAVVADMKRPPGMDSATHWLASYVMLSRSRSIDGLNILRAADRKELSSRPPKELLDEIDRWLTLEKRSHKATANLAVGAGSVRHATKSTVGEKHRFAVAVKNFVRAWALCSRVWHCGV